MTGNASSPLRLVVIQPTPFCNIDCSYCYLANRSATKIISIGTLKAISRFLDRVPKRPEPLSIVWHAGEPLVVRRELYRKAFEVLSDKIHSFGIRHHFQTNGTLIDDQWCEFFKEYDVHVGVSVDGPKDVHDSRRLTRSGKGTFDKVMAAIAKLKQHNVRFSTISVVTSALLEDIEAAVRFFGDLGSDGLAFNVEEVEGANVRTSLNAKLSRGTLIRFFEGLASLQASSAHLRVRELDMMRARLRAPTNSAVDRSTNQPGGILNFDVDGNVSTFSPELLGMNVPKYGHFAWGNAHLHTWQDVERNPQFERAHLDITRGVERCAASCGYFSVCGGGDPSNKLAEHGTFDAAETTTCILHLQAVADFAIAEAERRFRASQVE